MSNPKKNEQASKKKKFQIEFDEILSDEEILKLKDQKQDLVEELLIQDPEQHLIPKKSIWNQKNNKTNQLLKDISQPLNKKQNQNEYEIDKSIQTDTIQPKKKENFRKDSYQKDQTLQISMKDDCEKNSQLKIKPYKKRKEKQPQIVVNNSKDSEDIQKDDSFDDEICSQSQGVNAFVTRTY